MYEIILDATADVNPILLEKYKTPIVPMTYTIGQDTFVHNGKTSENELTALYNRERAGEMTQTTQINPYSYEEFFRPYLDNQCSILYICFSSGMSSTYNSALIAKSTLEEEYPKQKIMIVDSKNVSVSEALLLEKAIRNRDSGMSLEDNYEDINKFVNKIGIKAIAQDLNYLKRGGRISAATAVVGTALGIRPILTINESGKIISIDKKRGEKAAINALIKSYEDNHDPAYKTVYIAHSDSIVIAQKIADAVKNTTSDVKIIIRPLTPIAGAHTGPDLIALAWVKKD